MYIQYLCMHTGNMSKSQRQETLRNIVAAKRIERQDELVRLLRRNGFNVTQASISRDLDELGIVKAGGKYVLPGIDAKQSKLGLRRVDLAGENLLVVRCSPGFASAVASMIDALNDRSVVGTIAGDDTVFVAVSDRTAQKSALAAISTLMES